MKLPRFDLSEPKSLKSASRLLAERGDRAMVIAGGTDLMQSLKDRLKSPELLVDLGNLPHLDRIEYSTRRGLKIGALVTIRQLARDPLIRSKYPMLSQSASGVGSPQLQAMGTVGGNLCQDSLCLYYNRSPMMRLPLEPCLKLDGKLCNAVSGSLECWAVYSGDLAPVLMALDATVTIADSVGKYTMPLSEFYSGDGKRPNRLKAGQILTEISVPSPLPGSGGVYLKMRQRQTVDYPLLGVAVHLVLADGYCRELRLALTAVDRAPLLIREAEEVKGKRIGAEEIERLAQAAFRSARPLNNVIELTPKYRRQMVKVYVRSAIARALEQATQGGERG
ncbi:MAG: FAD binding domain-containing protein [Acidobacteriota bacterium]